MSDDLFPLAGAIDRILARIGTARASQLSRLVEEWGHLAGPPWAKESRPIRLRERELLVEVDGGAAASLLRYRVPDLLRALEAALGPGIVESVVLRVARSRRVPGSPG